MGRPSAMIWAHTKSTIATQVQFQSLGVFRDADRLCWQAAWNILCPAAPAAWEGRQLRYRLQSRPGLPRTYDPRNALKLELAQTSASANGSRLDRKVASNFRGATALQFLTYFWRRTEHTPASVSFRTQRANPLALSGSRTGRLPLAAPLPPSVAHVY